MEGIKGSELNQILDRQALAIATSYRGNRERQERITTSSLGRPTWIGHEESHRSHTEPSVSINDSLAKNGFKYKRIQGQSESSLTVICSPVDITKAYISNKIPERCSTAVTTCRQEQGSKNVPLNDDDCRKMRAHVRNDRKYETNPDTVIQLNSCGDSVNRNVSRMEDGDVLSTIDIPNGASRLQSNRSEDANTTSSRPTHGYNHVPDDYDLPGLVHGSHRTNFDSRILTGFLNNLSWLRSWLSQRRHGITLTTATTLTSNSHHTSNFNHSSHSSRTTLINTSDRTQRNMPSTVSRDGTTQSGIGGNETELTTMPPQANGINQRTGNDPPDLESLQTQPNFRTIGIWKLVGMALVTLALATVPAVLVGIKDGNIAAGMTTFAAIVGIPSLC